MKRLLSNLSYSFIANLVTMLVSVLIVLLIPRFWGEIAYGYYQLYLFYISYVGFFHLGWIDGIYLRIGGQSYAALDRALYSGQFRILLLLVILATSIVMMFSSAVVADSDKFFVIGMTCVCLVMYLPITYINYIFQSTNKIQEYAKIILSEKVVFIGLLLLIFMFQKMEYKWLIYADLSGKAVSFAVALFYARSIIFTKVSSFQRSFQEMVLNISIGCKLMIGNVASMLIIGIVRFAIEGEWGIATFGKVSLALSVSNLLIVFVTAVSVVIFPLLKHVDVNRQMQIYNFIRHLLMPCLFLILFFYYPAQYVLGSLLPAYQESLAYLAIMMPVCVFECKMAVLVNTYLKVLRKEKQILIVNLIAVALSFFMTLFTVYYLKSLQAAIIGIVVLVAVRVCFAEFCLKKAIGISIKKETICEILLTVLFILSSWCVGGFASMMLYGIGYLLYLICMKNELRFSINFILRK